MAGTSIRVLLVEDNEGDAFAMRNALSQNRYGTFSLTHASRLAEGLERLGREEFDVILLDLGLPDSQGLATLQGIQRNARGKAIVVLTALASEELAVQSLQQGAQDYLVKDHDIAAILGRAIRYAIARKDAEEAVKRSDERLAMAVDASGIGIGNREVQTGRVFWSEQNERLFGMKPGEFDGRFETFWRCVHPDDIEELKQKIHQAETEHKDFAHEYRIVWPDKSVHWVSGRGRAIYDDSGRPVRMMGTTMDVTARKTAEEAAKVRDAELAHLSRVGTMGQMAVGLAHELTQPLAAILNYASVCLDQANSARPSMETIQTAIVEVMGETRRAGAIISRMRSFVRKQGPRKMRANVNGLVKEAIDIMGFELRHHSIRPSLELNESLPAVMADKIQVEQVLVNLIYNALEAMGDDESTQKELTLQSSLNDAGQGVRISVIDTGPGVAPENMPKLFGAFFTTKSRGLGMGLNICRSIVESHGGRLTAEANPKRGMRFSFTLPIAEGATA